MNDFRGQYGQKKIASRPKSAFDWRSGKVEGKSLNMQDYPDWEIHQRPRVMKPQGELKVGNGSLDSQTVHKNNFTGQIGTKHIAPPPKSAYDWKSGSIDNKSVKKVDYPDWGIHTRPTLPKPESKLKISDGTFDGKTIQMNDFTGQGVQREIAQRPKTAYDWNLGGIESETVNMLDYRPWTSVVKPKAARPTEQIINGGNFTGDTVQKTDYTGNVVSREIAPRPKSAFDWKSGTIDTNTSNKSDYRQWNVKERSETDYAGVAGAKADLLRPSTHIIRKSASTGNLSHTQSDYPNWQTNTVPARLKPEDELKIGEGEFDGRTIQKEDYAGQLGEAAHGTRPNSEYDWKSGDVVSESTNKSDYRDWEVKEKPKILKPEGQLVVGN
ncbi:Stabilizer of axonemal microtubules 2 [Nymphon striatum]|nr:Stabilizer of axonemal microtubules 2 [Nymphon striatum]